MKIMPLFIIVLLNEISYQMVIPAMGHVVKLTSPHASLNLINTLYGAGIAVFTVAVILGSPIIGFLSDQYGRKKVLSASILLMFFSSVLFILALYLRNIFFFLIARFLSGLAGASTAIVQAAITDISKHRTRAVYFSLVGLALTLGLIIGPLLGGYFINNPAVHAGENGLFVPFIFTALICLLNLLLFIFLFPETSPSKKYHHKYNIIFIKSSFGLLTVFFLLESSWSLYYLSLPLFLADYFSYTPQKISLFLSASGISMCAGLVCYKIISKYLNNINMIKLFFSMFIISLILLLIFSKNIFLNWLIILPITASVALSYIALMALISESTAENHQGVLMGVTLTTMAFAWTLTGFFDKFLYSMNSVLPFIISAASLIIGLIGVSRHDA